MVCNGHLGGKMWDVVVIGAGMAGLIAAQQLHQGGYRVLVVEKSRGLGGRLATRRVEGQPIDHGCRFLSPFRQEPDFLAGLLQRGVLRPWSPQSYDLDGSGEIRPRPQTETYYGAPLGMTAVAKVLADGLPINRLCRVNRLSPRATTWTVTWENSQGIPATADARGVIAAIPAPQFLPLVSPAGQPEPLDPCLQPLAAVQFDPVITVLAGYAPGGNYAVKGAPAIAPTVTGVTDPGWMIFGQGHNAVRWLGLDSGKRSQPAYPTVVIHSTPGFAANYLDSPELTDVGQALLQAAARDVGTWLQTPTWTQTHRWRYGFVNYPLDQGIWTQADRPGLVACGDWCGGPNAEAAFNSGKKAANKIMQALT